MICMESSEQMGVYIFSPISTNRMIFGKGCFFHLDLSEYTNPSHKFQKLEFLWSHTSLLWYSCTQLHCIYTVVRDLVVSNLPGIKCKKDTNMQMAQWTKLQARWCLVDLTDYHFSSMMIHENSQLAFSNLCNLTVTLNNIILLIPSTE